MLAPEILKQQVATAALEYLLPRLSADSIIGIGTGSTANCFIDQLAQYKDRFAATVASSDASAARLNNLGIKVLELNEVSHLVAYVDGADETNPRLELIKGGGAALTREKLSPPLPMNLSASPMLQVGAGARAFSAACGSHSHGQHLRRPPDH